jgi:hypothetical protein
MGNFGAVGVGWIFSNEPFIKDNLSFMTFAKLRASYGLTGNDQIGDYKFYNTYSIADYPYNANVALNPTALYNPDYSWETTKKLEAAIEFGFLDDRLSLEVGFYRNRSSNQLVDYQLPAITGFTGVLSNFDAVVENKGWEAMFNAVPVQMPNFNWSISLNFSTNRNKLVKFPGLSTSSYSGLYEVGKPLSIRKLYTYKGVNPETGKYEVVDQNDDGILDGQDQRFLNVVDPKYYGGVNNTFRYKSIELSFLIQFTKQYKIGYQHSYPGTISNLPNLVLDRWKDGGDLSPIGRYSQAFENIIYYGSYVLDSDYMFVEASFIRLKTLSISYGLPSALTERAKLKRVRVFLQGQNLLTVSDYLGLDPDTGNGLPPLWMATVGVQLGF